MNRRSFLVTAGAATAAGLFTKPAKAVNPPLTSTTNLLLAGDAHSHHVLIANAYGGSIKAADWSSTSHTLLKVHDNITSSGLDVYFRNAANKALQNASIFNQILNSDAIDVSAVLQAVKVYQPSFDLAHLGYLMNLFHLTPTTLRAALFQIANYGASPFVFNAAQQKAAAADWLNLGNKPKYPFGNTLKLGGTIVYTPPSTPIPLTTGIGPGLGCRVSGDLMDGAGIVLGVIGVMCAPEFFAMLAIPMAFWAWSGAGMLGWSLANLIFC